MREDDQNHLKAKELQQTQYEGKKRGGEKKKTVCFRPQAKSKKHGRNTKLSTEASYELS